MTLPPITDEEYHEILGRCPGFAEPWHEERPADIPAKKWWQSFGMKVRLAVALLHADQIIRSQQERLDVVEKE